MKTIRYLRRAAAVIAILLASAGAQPAAADEPLYLGKKLSHWLNVIRDRNQETISLAFDAIRSLGPEAREAVPDLTALVAAPFTPIRVGQDSNEVIASKIVDIEMRAEAIDALASIGEFASSATMPLVQWALAVRVTPTAINNSDDEELFVELVMMDTEQRMRVVGAIGELGPDAAPIIAGLLVSPDAGKRKLGVAILSEGALPLAAKLLHSRNCEDRGLGFVILQDMDLVVAKLHLDWLGKRIACEAN